jgi:hypothetical protein
MSNEVKKAKRGADGKFLPGHTPPKSPGRPRGSKGVQARTSKLAGERLEQMLGRATEIISDELEDGNAAIAQWLIDRVRPPGRSDYVQLTEDIKLDTVEDIVTTSERIAVAVSQGEISLQDAKWLQEVLGRHVQLKSMEELSVLRAEVEKLRRTRSGTQTLDNSLLPKWGRLREADQKNDPKLDTVSDG